VVVKRPFGARLASQSQRERFEARLANVHLLLPLLTIPPRSRSTSGRMQSPVPPAHLSFHNLAAPSEGSPPLPASAAPPPPSSQLVVVEPSASAAAASELEPPTPKRFLPPGQVPAHVPETAPKPSVYTAVYSSVSPREGKAGSKEVAAFGQDTISSCQKRAGKAN